VLTGGLLLLFLRGWVYPRTRREVVQRKNELYNLVQIELLPSLFQDTTHSLQLLQTSLTSFQHGFADSIASLRGMLDRNFDTLKAQERIAEALQKVDVMQLTNANVDMFETLNQSGDELRKFRDYLTEMNHFVENTTALNEKVNHFLYRTQHLETIADKIKQTLDQNDRLHHFIASHFAELESRGHLIQQAVVKVDDVLDKSLGELMEHTQHKIRAIRELSAQEENQLLKTYEENKHVFGKLARIDDLHRNFADYKAKNLETQQQVLAQLQTLNQHLSREGGGGFFKKLFGS
jgi:vacuolar-type H+-ATPase subunit I/STV1